MNAALLNEPISGQPKLHSLRQAIAQDIIGQRDLVEQMLVCLLCDGHILIEGMPGLAKTTAAKAMAEGIEGAFHRIQFTPDLLPSDLIGTEIYVHETSSFSFRRGPLFNNVLLADEINRAPAKVQSALLEAMGEKQVTVGHTTYPLPQLYMVIATQNPIEHEGTYNLPEAQLDRFLMNVVIDYPDHDEERRILELSEARQRSAKTSAPQTTQADIFAARREAAALFVDPKLKDYIVSLVGATRQPKRYSPKLAGWLRHGASPRASIGLLRCAKALAWLEGAEFVTPRHIRKVAPSILRHRIIPSFESEAEDVSREAIVGHLLEVVAIP